MGDSYPGRRLRDELFTVLPEISNGMAKVPTGPDWGTDLKEDVAKR